MLKILSLISIIFLAENVLGQNFEGKITYKLTCKSNLKDYSDEQVCSGAPRSQKYFIKNGEYKFIFPDSSDYQWMLYINKENKIYTKMLGNDTIYWKDGNQNIDTVLEARINKNVTRILGLQCDEMIFICKEETHKFYYSSKISVDEQLFRNHKYGNLFNFFSRSKSLVLKEVIENKYFTLESVATEIQSMKIDNNFFSLPTNSILSKSIN